MSMYHQIIVCASPRSFVNFVLKKILIVSIFCLVTLFLLFPARATAGPYVIKLANIAPEGSVWGDMAVKIKMYVESRSRGRLKLIWYMAGVIGEDEPEIHKRIESGELQGAILTIVGLGRIQPAVRVVFLPFLLQSYEEADYVLDSMMPDFKRLFALTRSRLRDLEL